MRFRYNGLNQMVSEDSPEAEISYSYDARGNLSQTENETTGERTAYRYSVEGTLSSVRKGTGEAMTQVQENLYDHTGARVQSTQEGATHTYCYADGRMLCDGTGSSAVSYLYAGDTVACGYQGEHAYLYMQDQQGSTYGIVREDGAVANTYRYTDFGETEAVTDTGFDNVLCYSGSVYDKVTGLYYLNARYYDPETANFLSQDTYRGETGDYDQWNLYAYCANDPVNHVDITGHDIIYLNATKGAWGQGHAALLIRHKNKWRYYSWELLGYKSEHAKLKVVKKGIKRNKVSLKVNDAKNIRCRDRKKKPYDQYIYIKTDSEKAYSYAKRIKKGKYYHVYGLTTRNCGWVAIDILSHTPIGKEKKKQFKNKLYYDDGHGKQLKLIIPNQSIYWVASIFKSKVVKMKK